MALKPVTGAWTGRACRESYRHSRESQGEANTNMGVMPAHAKDHQVLMQCPQVGTRVEAAPLSERKTVVVSTQFFVPGCTALPNL